MAGPGQKRSWASHARALGGDLPRGAGHPEVLKCLVHPAFGEGKWLLACSGGADSLAMTLWCWAHFAKDRSRMCVAHLNHGLRGDAAEGDAAFVEDAARGLGLEFVGEHLEDIPGDMSEEALRTARLEFYARHTAGGDYILTGHQLDDVLETHLMRMARGASSAGLCAPRPVRRAADGQLFLRPFLDLEKEALLTVMTEQGIPFREDQTNRDGRYFRNRMRAQVVPNWKSTSPGSPAAGLRLTRQWLEEDDRALTGWAESVLEGAQPAPGTLDLEAWRDLPRAVARRLLLTWLNARLGMNPFARQGMELALDNLYHGARNPDFRERISCGSRHFLVIGARQAALEVLEDDPAVVEPGPLPLGVSRLLPPGKSLTAEAIRLTEPERVKALTGCIAPERDCLLDLSKLEEAGFTGELWVRSWEQGDRYHPLGAPGQRKLQDCFTDRKIPESERKSRPVVCLGADRDILWCPGLLPADSFKLTPKSDAALRLTYRSTASA